MNEGPCAGAAVWGMPRGDWERLPGRTDPHVLTIREKKRGKRGAMKMRTAGIGDSLMLEGGWMRCGPAPETQIISPLIISLCRHYSLLGLLAPQNKSEQALMIIELTLLTESSGPRDRLATNMATTSSCWTLEWVAVKLTAKAGVTHA